MIDNNLISQLKAFIRKRYELVDKPVLRKIPGNFATGSINLNTNASRSFENLTDTLTRFIKKERKSETFSTMLERLRLEKGITAAQLYNGAWVKKQLYSKIMGKRNYHPSKNTVIAFGLSLKLDGKSMDDLLESAGYRFSNSSIADLVILSCLDLGLYDLHDVNALLLSADQRVLCRE
jgi:hypothetical protein